MFDPLPLARRRFREMGAPPSLVPIVFFVLSARPFSPLLAHPTSLFCLLPSFFLVLVSRN